MKKSFIAFACACIAFSASAQRASDAAFASEALKDYNRIGVSYNNEHYGFNKDMEDELDFDGVGLNGFGIDYIHGFHLSSTLPLFLETGINFNYNFGSKSESYYDEEYTFKLQDMNFQVPVNLGWRFGLTEEASITPYVGLNFKLHMISRFKEEYKEDGEVEKTDWTNLFSDDKDEMGDKDATWNRFQMGWHVGVGFQYSPLYVGVQYGTDFIKAYSHDYDGFKPSVNTGNLKVTVAYTF
ncbi:MAG: porin family protein [Firmicutes bacterium]|nr:porin family protein [Bacillota bacterium]MCM1401950.1 porin family protein [Bacteroides sp.]MCM1477977.1 porin family protein [Bacteroides sp.]